MAEPAGNDGHVDLAGLLQRQRAAFAAEPRPSAEARRARLQGLINALKRHQSALTAAISADFGGRAEFESLLADVLGPVFAARHAMRHLARWMRPARRHTELLFFSNSAWVEYQPKGVVGIIAPWNFPAYLALGPLIAAIAAGNRAMIKGSEYAPMTNLALQALLDDAFGVGEVPVITGEADVARAFTALPFDHLVFTGAPAIAPSVMASAARNLTPVTLELGGKSPAIISAEASLQAVAASIAHGKLFNAGQICVSPDYALVPTTLLDPFVEALTRAATALYPTVAGNLDYTQIINDRQHARLTALLQDASDRGAVIREVGGPAAGRRRPLAIVTQVSPQMKLMQEEIFGPVLPVIAYESLDEAIAVINAGTRPLAMYPYGFDEISLRSLLDRTHSGGVTINDWGWHVFNHDLPFGGIGQSGMGSYHGVEGFRELSHTRAIFRRQRFFPVHLFRPPYGRWVQRLVVRLYLGKNR